MSALRPAAHAPPLHCSAHRTSPTLQPSYYFVACLKKYDCVQSNTLLSADALQAVLGGWCAQLTAYLARYCLAASVCTLCGTQEYRAVDYSDNTAGID